MNPTFYVYKPTFKRLPSNAYNKDQFAVTMERIAELDANNSADALVEAKAKRFFAPIVGP